MKFGFGGNRKLKNAIGLWKIGPFINISPDEFRATTGQSPVCVTFYL